MGYTFWTVGDHREALRWYARALAALQNPPIDGDHRPWGPKARVSEALILNNIGMAQLGLEGYGQAEELFRRALLDVQDPNLQARIENNLGVALIGLARFDEAERQLTDALARRRRLHGDIHRDVATTIDNIGRMWLTAGDLPTAMGHLRQAYDMRKQHFADSRIEIAKSLHNLGCLAAALKDEAQACNLFEAALTIRQEHLPQHPDTAATLVCLGELERALEIYEIRFGPDHPRTRDIKDALVARAAKCTDKAGHTAQRLGL